MLLHLIRDQGSIPAFVVDQASSSQPVGLLMSRFFFGTGKPEIKRHFTGKPCGDYAGRFGLDLKGKAAVERVAVGRDGRFDVRVACNGFDAGMMVKEYRPDLIVLDVMLPDINGKEVCQRVRSDPSLEDVRILCISGMIEDDKIQDLRDAGADDFMHKPFDIEILIERMCVQLGIESVPTSA